MDFLLIEITKKNKKGNIMKWINVKLKGGKDNVVNEPITKGIKYNVKKRLFKYFSNIYNIQIFIFNIFHF